MFKWLTVSDDFNTFFVPEACYYLPMFIHENKTFNNNVAL